MKRFLMFDFRFWIVGLLTGRAVLDARAARNFTNSVAIINACQPYHWKDQYAKTCYFPEETRQAAALKWKDVLKLD